MNLEQDVHVRTDAGQEVDLRSAFVDFKAGTVVSTEPVTVSLGNGVIEAKGIEVSDNGKIIQFRGRVQAVFRTSQFGPAANPPPLLPQARRARQAPQPVKSASMISIKQAALAAGALLLALPVLEAPASAQADEGAGGGLRQFRRPARSRSRSMPTASTSTTRKAARCSPATWWRSRATAP